MASVAVLALATSGCAFFGDMFGIVDNTQGKLGEGQSVCNNLSKNEIFSAYYGNGGYFSELGSFIFSGQYTIAQVENLLGAQVHYMEIKRSDKENICAYIISTNTAYKQTNLTSQEIAKLERALVDNDKYSEYEKRNTQKDEYYTALKFLKYHNRFTIPSESVGLKALRDLTNVLWRIDMLDTNYIMAKNIAIVRMLYGKAQGGAVYKSGALLGIGTYTNLHLLNSSLNSPMMKTKRPCVELSNAECSKQINEVRAIKNYAESLLK